jgi:hypothetical protein
VAFQKWNAVFVFNAELETFLRPHQALRRLDGVNAHGSAFSKKDGLE